MTDYSAYFPPLALQAGLTCLGAHVVLTALFAWILPTGPWTPLPQATAHQAVCLPLMMYLVYHGWIAWFYEQDHLYEQGMEGRIMGISPRGQDLSAVVWGMMLFCILTSLGSYLIKAIALFKRILLLM